MQTHLTDSPEEAGAYVRQGGVVAFPTETVYGLGANVFDEVAVEKIFAAKRRPADNPLIAHVGNRDQIALLTTTITDSANKLIDAFFPGPLTIVLPRSPMVPDAATAGLDTIGVRMPSHELAQSFLRACGTPVVAPSANLSGKPSPTTWEAVYDDLDGRIDCILKGNATDIGLESTVVDCTTETPLVLRFGAVSLEDLRSIVPAVDIYIPRSDELPRSPGLKHRHYSPKASVLVIGVEECVEDSAASGFIGIHRPRSSFAFEKTCHSTEEYARSLFWFFRECDKRGLKQIYCEAVTETGIGRALMDRIRRAAAG